MCLMTLEKNNCVFRFVPANVEGLLDANIYKMFQRFSVSVVFNAGKRSKFNSIFIYKYRSIFGV